MGHPRRPDRSDRRGAKRNRDPEARRAPDREPADRLDPARRSAAQQSASGKRLGELLVELGAIDDFDLARVLATQLDLPLADLRQSTPEDDAIALVPEAIARANVAIPVRRTDEGLQIAMAIRPGCRGRRPDRGSAGLAVVPMIAPPSDIRRAIDKSYRALGSA